jgi:hypothetical protein
MEPGILRTFKGNRSLEWEVRSKNPIAEVRGQIAEVNFQWCAPWCLPLRTGVLSPIFLTLTSALY